MMNRDRLYEELYPARQDRLRIGILSSGAAVFSRIMRSFKSEHPGVHFEPKIEKSEIIYELVLRGDLDMGFVTSYEEKPELLFNGVSCRVFKEYELVLCMAKSNSLYEQLHLKDGMIQEEEYPLLKSGKLSVARLPMIVSRVMDDILPVMGLQGEKNYARGDNNTELFTSILYLEDVYCFIPCSRLPDDIAQIRLPFHPKICRVMISRKGSRLGPLQKQFGELACGEIGKLPYYYDL